MPKPKHLSFKDLGIEKEQVGECLGLKKIRMFNKKTSSYNDVYLIFICTKSILFYEKTGINSFKLAKDFEV